MTIDEVASQNSIMNAQLLAVNTPRAPAAPWTVSEISGRARLLTLEPGLHALTVAPLSASSWIAGFALPATHIAANDDGVIEITAPPGPARDWFGAEGGTVFVKVRQPRGEVLVTTYGVSASAAPPAIAVRRLTPSPAPSAEPNAPPIEPQAPEGPGIATRILLHVARHGDQTFEAGYWAGDPEGRLPIEGLAITPLERLSADDVEYMAFAVNGAQTAWVGGSQLAGLRGHGIALAGFAVRLAPSARDRFDAIYEGAYPSGETAGPFRNGELCRPSRQGTPLIALRLRIVARPGMADPDPVAIPSSEPENEAPSESSAPTSEEAPAEQPEDPAAAALRYDMDLIRDHFDPVHYLATLRDSPSRAELRDIGLLQHFCTVGWKEGLDPCAWFSVDRYLGAHPDVVEAGWNPLVHYLLYGKDEARAIFPGTPPRSPESEAMAAMSHELQTLRGELTAARKVSQVMLAAFRDDAVSAPPPPLDPPKFRWGWLRRRRREP